MKKKNIAKLLSALLACTCTVATTGIGNVTTTNAAVANESWMNCKDFEVFYPGFGDVILGKYTGNSDHVVIPEGIGDMAGHILGSGSDKKNDTVKKITFPSDLRKIGNLAFADCTALEEIVIPEGVEEIGQSSFSGCTSLKSITLPSTIKKIDSWAFKGCSSLETINDQALEEFEFQIDKDSLSDGFLAFTDTKWEQDQFADDSIAVLGPYIYNVDRKNISGDITIPEGVKIITEGSFKSLHKIKSVVIPEGVTTIGKKAFWGCAELTSVTLPSTIETIEPEAFLWCSKLESVNLSKEELPNLTSVGADAFLGTKWYKNYRANPNREDLSYLGSDFWNLGEKDVVFPEGLLKVPDYFIPHVNGSENEVSSITLPRSLKEIGEGGLSYAANVTTLTIPEEVTKVGSYALQNCVSLESVTLPKNATYGERTFEGCQNAVFTLPADIQELNLDGAFGKDAIDLSRFHWEDCTRLERLSLNNCHVTDEDLAYISQCKSLKSLSLNQNQITDISILAGLTNLEELDISDNQIADIQPLAAMTKMDKLLMSNNQIEDITVVGNMTQLTRLEMSGNQISSIKALKTLTNEPAVVAKNNQITDITQLYELKNLGEIYILDNPCMETPDIYKALIHYEDIELPATHVEEYTIEPTYPSDDLGYYKNLMKHTDTWEVDWHSDENKTSQITYWFPIANSEFGSITFGSIGKRDDGDPNKPFTLTISLEGYSTTFHITLPKEAEGDQPGSGSEATPEAVLGDVDGDYQVTLRDAQKVLKHALKIELLSDAFLELADVNKSQKVDLTDAQLVLKYALKIIDTFPEAGTSNPGEDEVSQETPWVYDTPIERHKTMYDGTVIHEVRTWALGKTVWGYYDDEAPQWIFPRLAKGQIQMGMTPDYWDESLVEDAKREAFTFAVKDVASWSTAYYLMSGGVPNPEDNVKYITNAGGNSGETALGNAIACFVIDAHSWGDDGTKGDIEYGKYWRSYFGTYYASEH